MNLDLFGRENPYLEGDNRYFCLSTDHAASSYGQPVLLVDGEPFGAQDEIPAGSGPLGFLQGKAWTIALSWAERKGFVDAAHEYDKSELGSFRTKSDTPKIIKDFLALA